MKAIERAAAGAYWIDERGERYGNNRKMWASLKVKERRIKRAQERVVTRELVKQG